MEGLAPDASLFSEREKHLSLKREHTEREVPRVSEDFDPIGFELFGDDVLRRANQESYGHAQLPTFDLARAKLVVSFGADFLGLNFYENTPRAIKLSANWAEGPWVSSIRRQTR